MGKDDGEELRVVIPGGGGESPAILTRLPVTKMKRMKGMGRDGGRDKGFNQNFN